MANTLDSVSAATKLRRDMVDVQNELEQKRSEFRERMDRVKEREEALKRDRQDLQERLVQFYKYIQENEIKKNRANRKANTEQKAKEERHQKIVELKEQAKELEKAKDHSRDMYLKYVKYQKYLDEVLQHNESEEYQDAKDIIVRFQTLEDNKLVLQKRKRQLEDDLAKNKVSLVYKKQRRKNESVDLQNQLSELQNQLEGIQKKIKKMQDELESSIEHKGRTTKTIGLVRMSCQNLYDRCIQENASYKARGKQQQQQQQQAGEVDQGAVMLAQLAIIGDCLDDYSCIIQKHKEKVQKEKMAAQQAEQNQRTTKHKAATS